MMGDDYIACETVATVTIHLRLASDGEENRSGRTHPIPTLCGMSSAWDIPGEPMARVRCVECKKAARRREVD